MAEEKQKKCSSLLYCMRALTSSSSDQKPTKSPGSFEEILLNKIKEFKEILNENKDLENLRGEFESRVPSTVCPSFSTDQTETSKVHECEERTAEENPPCSIRWSFVEICLQLLQKLKDVLQDIGLESQKQPSTGANQQNKLSADALSINDQKTVLACVQFIVSLGIYPNLLPGVGIPVEKRTGFFELIKGTGKTFRSELHLYECLDVLLDCIKHPSLGTVILSRHLGDMLTGLIQLCNAPQSCYENSNSQVSEPLTTAKYNGKNPPDIPKQHQLNTISEAQRQKCKSELQRLLDRVYQPLIIKELLMIQSGMKQKSRGTIMDKKQGSKNEQTLRSDNPKECATPVWFVGACGKMLSERVMKPNGVQAVLRAVLETNTGSGGAEDWRKCDMVAMVIASCPSQASSLEEYYQQISQQVLELLHIKHAELAKQFVRVTSSTVKAMMKRDACLAKKYILEVIMAPLIKITENSRTDSKPGEVVCDEDSLTQCIEDIYKVFVSGSDPQDFFLQSLCPVIHPIFELYCFTRKGISHLRSYCQEILVRYLKHVNIILALRTLYALSFSEQAPQNFGVKGVTSKRMNKNKAEKSSGNIIERHKNGECEGATSENSKAESSVTKVSSGSANDKEVFDKNAPTNEISGKTANRKDKSNRHDDIQQSNTINQSRKLPDSEELLQKHKTPHLHNATSIKLMRQEYSYCHGDSGGIVIKVNHVAMETNDDIIRRLTGAKIDVSTKAAKRSDDMGKLTDDDDVMRLIYDNIAGDDVMGNLTSVDDFMSGEMRVTCLVDLLVAAKNDDLSGEFFLHLMTKLTGILSDNDDSTYIDSESDLQVYDRQADTNHKSLLTLQLVALMCDKLGPTILQDCSQMLAFIKSTLQRGCILADSEVLKGAFTSETLTMAFGMLSAMLGGATKIDTQERSLLEELQPLLEQLSLRHHDVKVQEMANDLRIAIATYGAVWSEQMKQAAENLGKRSGENENSDSSSKQSQDDTNFDEAFKELCDPLVPVRGHAIVAISRLLYKRNPKALSHSDALLKIFTDQLSHDDSYIYLAAVQGLVALSSIKTDQVLPHLAREFATCRQERGRENDGKSPATCQRSPETKIKLGEALVQAVRDSGQLVSRYSQHLLSSLLTGVRDSDEFVRASSLSNIGDVCKLLRFSVGSIIHEIFNCVSAVLNTDKSVHVRRAAVLVVTLLLQGLGKDTIQVLSSTLRDIYHMIKLVEACDTDETTRIHAQRALGELDTVMREFLFPKETFTKKIQVLP